MMLTRSSSSLMLAEPTSGETGNLLELPLDGGTDVLDLAEEWHVVGDNLGELYSRNQSST